MRPLLNKDFRRLRWLLRQDTPKPVLDYLVREVATLCRGGIEPGILKPLRNSVQRAEMKMAHVISVLCFVSRMRLRDRGDTNAIPLNRQMARALSMFFYGTALYGPTSKRQADMLFYWGEANRWCTGTRGRVSDGLIEQKIVERVTDLCTHVRARVERLYAFFELPPEFSLPQAPPVRSIWEMPPPPVSPPRPRRAESYPQRAPGFR